MERIYIAVGGPLPGIPGILSPGLYDIDWHNRTATPVQPVPESPATPMAIEAEPVPQIPIVEPPRSSLMTNGG